MSKSHQQTPDQFSNSWSRFWFKPTDPTTIGFLRIVSGLLIFYVHLAYSFDITAFFGKDAWWNLDCANKERRGLALWVEPLTFSERVNYGSVRLPDQIARPDAHESVKRFILSLPDSVEKRQKVLAYIYHLPNDGRMIKHHLEFLYGLSNNLPPTHTTEAEDKKWIRSLINPTSPIRENTMGEAPETFKKASPADLEIMIDEVYTLLKNLGVNNNQVIDIVNFFMDQTYVERIEFLNFVEKLPTSLREREQILTYLELWDIDPRITYSAGRPIFSFWFHVTNPNMMLVIHCSLLLCILLFSIGLWTRVTGMLVWVGTMSYLHRSQQVLFGMDSMQNILLMYLIVGDSGQALSIDRLRARYRASRAILSAKGKSVPWAELILSGPQKSWTANFGIRLLQIHFTIIYLASGLAKLKGTTWWNFSAPWYTIVNPEFSPVNIPIYINMVRFFAQYQEIISGMSALIVVFTLMMEIGFHAWVWSRLRPFFLMGSMLLHTGIAICMGLTGFSLMMFCMLIGYFPAELIKERVTWARTKVSKLKLLFNSEIPEHSHTVAILKAFDVAHQIELQDTKTVTHVQLMDKSSASADSKSLANQSLNLLVLLQSVAWLRYVPGFTLGLNWLLGSKTTGIFAETPASQLSSLTKPTASSS